MANIIPDMQGDSEIPKDDYQTRVLGWAREAMQESREFLKNQPGYSEIQTTIDQINGTRSLRMSSQPSRTQLNIVRRISKTLVSGLTDIKPFWQFDTFNKRYERTAANFNKIGEQWWKRRYIDQRHREAIQYGVAAGTSYLHLFMNEDIGDLDAAAEDPRDVFPIRPSGYESLQSCMGVMILRERTVNYVRNRYPEAAHKIKPDRDGALATSVGSTPRGRLMGFLSPFHDILFTERAKREMSLPTVDLFTCYIKDPAINKSGVPILKGPPDKNWSYTVEPGDPLYPRGRLIMFTRTAVLYDGPNIFWHGMFPLAKLTLDPWPWTWLGIAPMWDVLPLQESLNNSLRALDDHIARVGEPAVIGDKSSISRADWQKIDPRRPGLKILQNMSIGKGAQIVFEQEADRALWEYPDRLIEWAEKMTGSKDLTQLLNMGQVPTADTVEKIVQSMSPDNRLRSRVLEAFITEIGYMSLSNFFQFYDPETRAQILGPNALTPEDFDEDPYNVIPAYLFPDELGPQGQITQEALRRGPRPLSERAQKFMQFFTFHIAPGSLLNAAAIERKLLMLQLARAGMIDHWTLLDELGIKNVGQPPEGADTITERLQVEAQMGMGMMVNPAGRKASGQSTPRVTVKES